jgi:hypothetical protein
MRETRFPLRIDSDDSRKTLGVQWHPGPDQFSFAAVPPEKRMTFQDKYYFRDSKNFYPLGWISSETRRAKTLLQKIWKVVL